MTYSTDLRWRAVVLFFVYNIDVTQISLLLGASARSIMRWNRLFQKTGLVNESKRRKRASRWPTAVCEFVLEYAKRHPCFYLEELQDTLRYKFGNIKLSTSTICRALRFDLGLTRKVLSRRAREAKADQVQEYIEKLKPFYFAPEQLVFLDETAKDNRDGVRRYAWSKRNTPAVVTLPFARGERVSVLAAMSTDGFLGWGFTTGTFTRHLFHKTFHEKILPFLNPWPLPRSILILDNAKIHMYKELEEAVHATGALIFYLPPYCPQLNPIEVGFSLLKRWIKKNANLAFAFAPEEVLDLALYSCTRAKDGTKGIFKHCGYAADALAIDISIAASVEQTSPPT